MALARNQFCVVYYWIPQTRNGATAADMCLSSKQSDRVADVFGRGSLAAPSCARPPPKRQIQVFLLIVFVLFYLIANWCCAAELE